MNARKRPRLFTLAIALAVAGLGASGLLSACGGFQSAMAGSGESLPAGGMAPHQAGELYAQVQENEVIETSQDAMATFSLDVDTASYTIMRRDVTSGSLPRPDSVRVEEYVNFFDYGDAAPAVGSDTPFAVYLESAPSPFGPGKRLLRVALHGAEISAAQRPQANVVFLVDVSGSMNAPDKLGLVQYALTTLTNSLREDDRIAIVVYAGTDAVLLEPTAVENRAEVLDAIHGLRAGGSTNGAAGIRTAYDLAAQHMRPGGINRVVLCTDGDFNVGITGDALIEMIERQRERGITLSVLGFGRGNINDRDMERLADHGNGNYAYIDNRNEALRVLARDLAGTLQVIAGDVKVQVAFNEEAVRSFRLVGYENRVLSHQDFADDGVDAAEIGSGDFVTAFLEYELREGIDPRQDARQLAQVRLRYKDPGSSQSLERTHSISVSDGAGRFEHASRAFRFGASVAEYAEILRGSQHSQGAAFDEVLRIAAAAAGQSDDQREFLRLVATARDLHSQ